MMSGMLGGAAIQSWANYRSAAASQGMSEREAMLSWLQLQQQARDARNALQASTLARFLEGDEARHARDVDYSQYNPYAQQQALARLQFARGLQGATEGNLEFSPDFSERRGGLRIPRGGFDLPAISPDALGLAKQDFARRRDLALNPPGQFADRRQIMDYLG